MTLEKACNVLIFKEKGVMFCETGKSGKFIEIGVCECRVGVEVCHIDEAPICFICE